MRVPFFVILGEPKARPGIHIPERWLWIPAFAGMIILWGLLPLSAKAESIYDKRAVTVTGEAEVKVVPDRVVVSATASTKAKDLAKAKQENDRKLRALLDVAAKNGIAKENTKSLYTNVQPSYVWDQPNNKQLLDGYIVSNSVELTLDKPDQLGKLLQDLVNAGIDHVDSVNFTLIDDRPLREKTMLAALANARAKAERMAQTLGEKLGKPLQVVESGAGAPEPPRPMMAMAAMARKSEVAEAPPAGLIRIQQNVNVTFELKD